MSEEQTTSEQQQPQQQQQQQPRSNYHDRRESGGGRSDHGGDDSYEPNQEKRRPQRPRYRKKVLDTRNLVLDYKSPEVLERFVSKTGKILPRRMTGASARIQRKIAREVKRARMINLLPITRR